MVNLTMNESTASTIKREDVSLFVQDAIRDYIDEIQQRFNASNSHNLYYSTDVISIAYNEEGYFEKDSLSSLYDDSQGTHNYTKYAAEIYNDYKDFYSISRQGYSWSGVFCDWCFIKAYGLSQARRLLCRPGLNIDTVDINTRRDLIQSYNITSKDISLYGDCYMLARSLECFSKANRIITEPSVGCLVYFINDDNVIDHIGLVTNLDYRSITIVEGDHGDCVAVTSYDRSDSTIYKYAMPDYDDTTEEDSLIFHITPRRKKWLSSSEANDDEYPTRMNEIIITTKPITNPTWDVKESESANESEGIMESGTGDLLTPTKEELLESIAILAVYPKATFNISQLPNLTEGIQSNGGDNPYPDGMVFDWTSIDFSPQLSNFWVVPPDSTVTINLPEGSYNLQIYNKYSLTSIIGAIKAYDRYENIQINIQDFTNMNNLSSLHFSNSSIYGDISALSSCEVLSDIKLSRTNVSGDIGVLGSMDLSNLIMSSSPIDGDIEGLKNLSSLKSFNINDTGVSGDLSAISQLTNLEALDIANTYITGDIVNLKNLVNLEKLWINCDGRQGMYGDIANLRNLVNLKRLHIHGTDITGDISVFSNLESLTDLYIRESSISGNIGSIIRGESELSRITMIDLPNISGSLGRISSLAESLTYLSLHNIPIDDNLSSISSLRELVNLEIYDIPFSGDISSLSSLTNLGYLVLCNTSISGSIESLSSLTQLTHLDIHDNSRLSGNVSVVQNFPDLILCKLCGSDKITGDISSFNNCNSLMTLCSYDTSISGDISSICNMKSLEDLRIYSNDIYGNIINLKTLTNLRNLIIFAKKIRGNSDELKNYLTGLDICNIGSYVDNVAFN